VSGPDRFDVAVVGAGPAGIAAALAAARAGAATLLIERASALGGNVTQALVHTLCGLYRSDAARPEALHQGLPARIAAALERAGDAGAPVAAGRVFYVPIRPAGFGALAHALCVRTPALTLALGTRLVELALPADARATLRLREPGGTRDVTAHIVLDTSGDATAASLAGAPCDATAPERLQRASYIVRVEGLSAPGREPAARLRLSARVANAVRRGVLPGVCGSVQARPDAQGEDGLYLTLTLAADAPVSGLGDARLPALGETARELMGQVVAFLADEQEGFGAARIADWPRRVGVRETRRLRGRVVVERDDVLTGRTREDEVARSGWPIELWEEARRARFAYPSAPCSVPLGALVSTSHANLGAAGRCLSASHEAHGALRVIGTALATGEAIGAAAAIACDAGTTLASVAPAQVRARIAEDAEKPLP